MQSEPLVGASPPTGLTAKEYQFFLFEEIQRNLKKFKQIVNKAWQTSVFSSACDRLSGALSQDSEEKDVTGKSGTRFL